MKVTYFCYLFLRNSVYYFCFRISDKEQAQCFSGSRSPKNKMQDALSQYSTEEFLVELEERGKIENVLENFALVEIFQELRRRGFVGNVVQPSENTGYELLENGVTQYEWLK